MTSKLCAMNIIVQGTDDNSEFTTLNAGHPSPQTREANMASKKTPKSEAVREEEKPTDGKVPNPFDDLEALRKAQEYDEYMNCETTSAFNVRLLKESLHLRVNPNPDYMIRNQFTVATKQGIYYVAQQFRDALGPLPRRCDLHIAVDGHGEYFLLLIKQPNPGKDENVWYQTARMVAAAASLSWVKVTKPTGSDFGWGFIPVQHKMFEPKWPTKSFGELLKSAFPDRIVDRLSHDLIKKYMEFGA